MTDKYVKLINGKRWGRDNWSINQGEVKQCPDSILNQSGGHLLVVSKPRTFRKIVTDRTVKKSVTEDVDDNGES